MKKIIELDGKKYIGLFHYDKLEKKKVKIVKEKAENELNKSITNPENTLALISLRDITRGLSEMELPDNLGTYREIELDRCEFLKPKTYEDKMVTRIKIGNNIYSYDYFEQAKRIANALSLKSDFRLFVKKDETHAPLFIDFDTFGVLIAPRVECDD
jgi:hypothetical protein